MGEITLRPSTHWSRNQLLLVGWICWLTSFPATVAGSRQNMPKFGLWAKRLCFIFSSPYWLVVILFFLSNVCIIYIYIFILMYSWMGISLVLCFRGGLEWFAPGSIEVYHGSVWRKSLWTPRPLITKSIVFCWVDMLVDFISCKSSWVTPKHVNVWSLSKKVVFHFFFTLLAACFIFDQRI